MEKLYNNTAWRRIRGLRGLGILALSMAFCLTGLLALSSCDLDLFDDDDEAEPEPVEMRGFYTSVNENGDPDCTSERVQVFSEGKEVAERESNVTLVARGTLFGDAYFPQIGIEVGESAYNPKAIVSVYVSQTGEVFDRPGAYFLAARTDDDIPVADGETIYTGYWTGYAYRPGGEDALKPAVVCPYVLVPAGTDVSENIDDGECGPGGNASPVHSALAKYLEDGGSLKECHILLEADGDGVLDLP